MPVIHEDAVAPVGHDRPPFAVHRRRLSQAAGGQALGCSLIELPPGARAWPHHWHAANEEAIYVLEGEGTLRLGDREQGVRAGHYVALPPGPAHAHQMRNTGAGPLRYLCMSTMLPTDICVYPDSGKVGVFGGAAPGGAGERTVHGYFPDAARVDYWDGEEDGEAG